MTVIDFRWTFPCRPLNRSEIEPVVPVRLHLPTHVADLLVLVDTGADRTLLDGIYLRAAGIDIFQGSPLNFHGFLGAGLTAYVHPVRLQLRDAELDLDVAFSAQPLGRQVLGRDALYHFFFGLRERALELYFSPDE